MAVQLNYLAPADWQPEKADEQYVIVQFKLQLATGVGENMFIQAAASVARLSNRTGSDIGTTGCSIFPALCIFRASLMMCCYR